MKLNEITKCAKCGKGVMHTGLPLFWRVTIERFGIDKAAVDRRHGLEMFFGGGGAGARLAGAMGADEDIAHAVMDEVRLILCEGCACSLQPVAVAALAELGQEEEAKSDAGHGDAETRSAEVGHARI